MLYLVLKQVVKIALQIFFKTIHVRNAELLPKDVPMIIAANHPSTLMDPLVIASYIRQPLYYIARGNLFRTPLTRWLLRKLHMIPIYRKHETPELVKKNEEIFRECFRLLAQQKAILIFPEGLSKSERRLHKIKTGAARIALGAEASNDLKLGVFIVPVGLNYSDVGMFRSELFVNFAQPIDVSQFFEQYRHDEHEAVQKLTNLIRQRLERHTIDIENASLGQLVRNIETVYKRDLSVELGLSLKQKQEDFLVTKGIVEAVHHFYHKNPPEVEAFQDEIQRYLHNLEQLDLKDGMLKKGSLRQSLSIDSMKSLLFAVSGLPVYLFGLINNYLPYKLPDLLAEKMHDSIEYKGSTKMVIGIVTFTVFYTAQIFAFYTVLHSLWLTIIYASALPFTGFFALYYWNRMKRIRRGILFISLFYRRSYLISELIQQRLELIKALEKAKQDFVRFQTEQSGER